MKPVGAWRLLTAAGLCLFGLGLVWGTTLDFGPNLAFTLPYTYMGADGYYYTAPSTGFIEYGRADVDLVHGFRSDVRVVLVPAAVALAWAATHRTHASRRIAVGGVIALAALFLMACSRGMVTAAVAMTVALWLAVPVVWPDWARRLGRGRATLSRAAADETLSPPPAAPGPAAGSAF